MSMFGTVTETGERAPPKSWAERRMEEREFDAFLERAIARERREHSEAEQRRNEEFLEDANERAFKDDLAAIRAKHQPNPVVAELYRADVARFADWCADLGVGFLPATGHTVATMLAVAGEDADAEILDRLKRIVRAIEWAHDEHGHYLDKAPIAAVMSAIEKEIAAKGQSNG